MYHDELPCQLRPAVTPSDDGYMDWIHMCSPVWKCHIRSGAGSTEIAAGTGTTVLPELAGSGGECGNIPNTATPVELGILTGVPLYF